MDRRRSASQDYADVIGQNPRYAEALNTGSDAAAFAKALQRGGYATDPHYASKLTALAAEAQVAGQPADTRFGRRISARGSIDG